MDGERGNYLRCHKRVWKNLAYHIGRVGYAPDDEFTLAELGERLAELPEKPGRYRAESIERYLRVYFNRHVETPLHRTERAGYWKINSVLYRARPPPAQLKVGRPRKQKLDLTDGPVASPESEQSDYRGQDADQSDESPRAE